MKTLLTLAACILSLTAISAHAEPRDATPAANREYVILTGGVSLHEWEKFKGIYAHDHWWANFVHQAKNRLAQLREQFGPDAKITWLVYKEGYERRSEQDHANLIADIESVRDAYHLKLVWIRNGADVINYLNDGDTATPRSQYKVADFEYFGHSNCACFLLDYSNEIDSASKAYLHENMLTQIHGSDFTRDAFVKSYGCHTGEQMSQQFRSATGIRMWGAIGKTDYSQPNAVVISTPGGRWTY